MKKYTLTISILTLLTLVAGILWFVWGDGEDTLRKSATEVAEVQENTIAEARDITQDSTTTIVSAENTIEKTLAENTLDSTTNIDTSAWQEYCNEEYGFCVKYPSNMTRKNIHFIKTHYNIDNSDYTHITENIDNNLLEDAKVYFCPLEMCPGGMGGIVVMINNACDIHCQSKVKEYFHSGKTVIINGSTVMANTDENNQLYSVGLCKEQRCYIVESDTDNVAFRTDFFNSLIFLK